MKRRYILVYWFFLLAIDIDFLFTNADVLSYFTKLIHHRSFTNSPAGKEPACNAGDPGLIPGSERSIAEGIDYPLQYSWASLVAHLAKNLPAMCVTWVWSLGWEDPLEKGKDYPLQYPGLENSMQSMGSQRIGHDWATVTFIFTFMYHILTVIYVVYFMKYIVF